MRTILSIIKRGEIVCIFLVFALFVGIKPPITHAQSEQVTVMGYPAVSAYTTDHPIDPSLLILATPDGRYAIAPMEGCDSFSAGDYVFFYTDDNGQTFIWMPKMSPHDQAPIYNCHIQVISKVDDTPCFMDQYGDCDVTQEQ